ncbi:hypothetical protein TNCV_4826641 [Trichonephila clavipes]|nr:hypothetical protein TNCV_4826641 [Trichonephila clavipes]
MGLFKIRDVANVVHQGAIDDRGERRLRRCVRADRRATVEQLTTKMNQGGYQKCLPNYNSANIAASGPPKQTPGSVHLC